MWKKQSWKFPKHPLTYLNLHLHQLTSNRFCHLVYCLDYNMLSMLGTLTKNGRSMSSQTAVIMWAILFKIVAYATIWKWTKLKASLSLSTKGPWYSNATNTMPFKIFIIQNWPILWNNIVLVTQNGMVSAVQNCYITINIDALKKAVAEARSYIKKSISVRIFWFSTFLFVNRNLRNEKKKQKKMQKKRERSQNTKKLRKKHKKFHKMHLKQHIRFIVLFRL